MRDFSIKKLYYSISEVSKITEVEQYVLRYWESEFEDLQPQKNRAGNRAYTNRDIQLILIIKYLLREKKYTIEGAKKIITEAGVESLISSTPEINGPQKNKIFPEVQESVQVKQSIPVKKNDYIEPVRDMKIDKKELIEMRALFEEILKLL